MMGTTNERGADLLRPVGFFAMILIGAVAGWIAERVTRSDHGIFTNIFIGVAGAFVGAKLAEIAQVPVFGFFQRSSRPRSVQSLSGRLADAGKALVVPAPSGSRCQSGTGPLRLAHICCDDATVPEHLTLGGRTSCPRRDLATRLNDLVEQANAAARRPIDRSRVRHVLRSLVGKFRSLWTPKPASKPDCPAVT
jgi:uncharacterized membrane protein YeaQ/YmgE (transglycosylase-associated protein family)